MRSLSSRGTSCSSSPAAPARRSRRLAVETRALLKAAPGVRPSWKQTTDDVLINVPVDASVRGRQVAFQVHPKRLSIKVDGKPVLEGSLDDAGDIRPDECFWTLETEGGSKYIAVTLAKKTMGYQSWEQLLEEERVDTSVTHRVFLELTAGGEAMGRVALGLFGNTAPRTVENFRALITGEKGVGKAGKPLHFKGCSMHRIIPGFMAQGGDFTSGDGRGGESIYGDKFEDENLRVKHDDAGLLSMANAGPNTNGSQFFITYEAQPHLDGKHCVFGKVLAGMDVMRRIEALGSPSGAPAQPVAISDCGVLPDGEEGVEQVLDFNAKLKLANATA